jgi:hypothetical protein
MSSSLRCSIHNKILTRNFSGYMWRIWTSVEITGAAYSMAELTVKGLRGILEGGMDSWTFKDADVGMAYARRSVMDSKSHKTVYGPPEQHSIMHDLPMKYAIIINEWQKYATFGNQAKNEMYMERCYINKIPTGHKVWCLSSTFPSRNHSSLSTESPVKFM